MLVEKEKSSSSRNQAFAERQAREHRRQHRQGADQQVLQPRRCLVEQAVREGSPTRSVGDIVKEAGGFRRHGHASSSSLEAGRDERVKAGLPASSAEALRRRARRGGRPGHQPGRALTASHEQIAEVHELGCADQHRDRRREHHPRHDGGLPGHGPRQRRLHGHAGQRHQRHGAAGRAREGGHADARADRDRDQRGRRALHPPPGHPAPGKGSDRGVRRPARATRTSPPIRPPPCGRPRSTPR